MKKTLRSNLSVLLTLCLVVSAIFGVGIIFGMPTADAYAAESQDGTDNIVVTDTIDEVLAEYQFATISDTECSVRISNKAVATKAVIPSTAEISGKTYKVTEVVASGFASAAKLKRVSLPYTIKKVGNMAFGNCTSLQRISLSNVEELGANVFYKCTSLEKLVLPDSLVKMGATILRGADTQVLARSSVAKEGWAANWNTGNANTNVEYNSTFVNHLNWKQCMG